MADARQNEGGGSLSDVPSDGTPTHTSSAHAPHNLEDARSAVKQLNQHCEEHWWKLQALQQQLVKGYRPQGVAEQAAPGAVASVYEHSLQAQINFLRAKSVEPLPQDPVIQFELLREGLEQSISELQDTLALVIDEKKEMLADMQHAERTQGQLTQLHRILQSKLDSVRLQPAGNRTEEMQIKELENETARVDAYGKKVMQQLGEFVNKHFPPPTKQQILDWKSKRQHKATPNGSFLSLNNILEQLMNRCVETPHDPYVDVDGTFWPPYVELLLRCGIASKHPQDDQRMKLMPFHS